jgi:AAA domain
MVALTTIPLRSVSVRPYPSFGLCLPHLPGTCAAGRLPSVETPGPVERWLDDGWSLWRVIYGVVGFVIVVATVTAYAATAHHPGAVWYLVATMVAMIAWLVPEILRWRQDDVLVLDEASQLGTADLALIAEAARLAGARVIVTGDTAQLGALEAGGILRLLAQELPAAQLHEVRRFDAVWEREASVRLRGGDLAAIAAYDRRGRIRGGDQDAAYDRATSMWVADRLRGKDVLLLAGPTPRPPSYPAGCRSGSPSWARSARGGPRWPTATTRGWATWSGPGSTPRSTQAAAP